MRDRDAPEKCADDDPYYVCHRHDAQKTGTCSYTLRMNRVRQHAADTRHVERQCDKT